MRWLKMLMAPKNELIHNHQYNDVLEVEIATYKWVTWWNKQHLHESLNYLTPKRSKTGILEITPRIKRKQKPRHKPRNKNQNSSPSKNPPSKIPPSQTQLPQSHLTNYPQFAGNLTARTSV